MAGGDEDWRKEAGLDELFCVSGCNPLQQGWHCLVHAWVWHLYQLVVARGALCRVKLNHFLSQLHVLLSLWANI